MLSICYQYVMALAVMVNSDAHFATPVRVLHALLSDNVFVPVMLAVPTTALLGFFGIRKLTTLLCLIPQQMLLYLSAGGAFHAIWNSHYADGTIRPVAFILTDQILVILLAVFHSWALLLILRYGSDARE